MIRIDYHKDEDLKDYEVYGIQKTEIVKSEYGDRRYVSFGQGLTVGYGSTYLGDGDSVWYVKIWNPVTKKEDHIGMGYENSYTPDRDVQYDATPEVKAEWEAWKAEQEKIRQQKEREYNEYLEKCRIEAEAKTPSRGKVVRVVKGRKVPIGSEGRVFWYGRTAYGYRVGIELTDGNRVFTADSNVEVVAQEDGRPVSIHKAVA